VANKTVQNIFFRCTSDDRYLMVTTVAKIMTTVYACKLTEHSNGKKAGHFTVQDDHNFPGTFLQKSGLSFENRDRGHLTLDSWWTFGHFHYSAQSFTYGFGRCCQHIINCNGCSLFGDDRNVRFAVPAVKMYPSLCLCCEEQLQTR